MLQEWKELATQLRMDSIRATTAAGSGHSTSSMSAADLMAVLLARYLRCDWAHPHASNNDRLIFSKGHAAPLLYAMHRAAAAPCSAAWSFSRPIPTGAISSPSTSISTATPAPASAPAIKPAGPIWSPS
jgi:hypothetical protein